MEHHSTSMDQMILIAPSVHAGPDVAFCSLVRLRILCGAFEAAVGAIRERSRWQADPEAIRQLGVVLHCFAHRSRDHGQMYSYARFLYRRATTLTDDARLNADALASVGTAYLEEQRLYEADLEYGESLRVDANHRFALLGRIAVACANRSLDGVRRTCHELTGRISAWHQDREVVAMLATDPHYGFLRGAPVVFFECFGGSPGDVEALHQRHQLETLIENLDRDGDSGWETRCCTARASPPILASGTGGYAVTRRGGPASPSLTEPGESCLLAAYHEVEQASPRTIRAHDADLRIQMTADAYFAAAY